MRYDECSMEYTDDNLTAQVLWDKENEVHVLQWTDGINEWSREYDTLALALIALGCLLHAPHEDIGDMWQATTLILSN